MRELLMADYRPDGDDWTVTVTGGEKPLTATAPGIIAARDRVDQLVGSISPADERHTVVHLLRGDAIAFTATYLHARHGLSDPDEPAGQPAAAAPTDAPAADTPAAEPAADGEPPADQPVAATPVSAKQTAKKAAEQAAEPVPEKRAAAG
jgi:hypothetical protein